MKGIAHAKSNSKQKDSSDDNNNSNLSNNCTDDDSYSDSDDDHPVYACLSETQFRKLNDSIKHYISHTFVDKDYGMKGIVVGIVREVRSKQLCLKYHAVGESRNIGYMWVSTLSIPALQRERYIVTMKTMTTLPLFHHHMQTLM